MIKHLTKTTAVILSVMCVFGMLGCSQNNATASIVNTFEETPVELIEEYFENSQMVTTAKYYEMSDGTWKTDEHTYRYKLEITGRLNNSTKDSTYTILSNTDRITFEQAWKASGLSSNASDYFNIEDTVIVGMS
ncbi:MAG: hypothetical protein DBX46_04950 [Clostridiales bacterium]|nr:MAG: hypothetical protein DBX46_04950 [Clostridiales bacterium]